MHTGSVTQPKGESAEHLYDRFHRGDIGPAEAAEVALSLYQSGTVPIDDAVDFLEHVRHDYPDLFEVNAALARARVWAGTSRPYPDAGPLSTDDTVLVEDRIATARVFLTIGRIHDAHAELRAAVVRCPDDPDVLGLLGRVLHMRGELTEAIACWEQLRLQHTHRDATLVQVGILHRLAQDPQRDRSVPRADATPPTAQQLGRIEVEQALRHLVERRTAVALQSLARLAEREREGQADVYKLALMTKAWIHDLVGETNEAIAALELLGEHPHFGVDCERLHFLARLCARSTDAARSHRAIFLYRHLGQRVPSVSLVGELAALCERIGLRDDAATYRHQFLSAFLRRMGHPTRDEWHRVATLRPLRLAEIRTLVAPTQDTLAGSSTERDHALDSLASGADAEARARFDRICASREATACDWAYRAELNLSAGAVREAATAYLCALERPAVRATHADLMARLLSLLASDPAAHHDHAARLADRLRDPTHRRDAYEALRLAARRDPMNTAHWHSLALFERLAGMPHEAERHTERGDALDQSQVDARNCIGRVQCVAAYYLLGRPKGLVHEVWADRYPAPPLDGGRLDDTDIFGNIAPDLRTLLRSVCDATRVYVRQRFPHRCADVDQYRYTFKMTKDDEQSSGASAGLAAAVAFASRMMQLAVPQDVSMTGALVVDASQALSVRRVGDIEHKVAGAYHKGLRCIVVPAENRPDLVASTVVPEEIVARLVVYVRNLEDALQAVFGPTVWDV